MPSPGRGRSVGGPGKHWEGSVSSRQQREEQGDGYVWEGMTCQLLYGSSHSVLSHRPTREVFPLSHSADEETEAREGI